MLVRILAWIAVIFGGAITVETLAVGQQVSPVCLLFLVLGVVYFARNGFLKKKGAESAPPTAR